jgi:hypothetical protein
LEASGLGQTTQTGDQATRRHGEGVVAVIRPLDGNGQSIRDDEETTRRGSPVFDNARHRGYLAENQRGVWYVSGDDNRRRGELQTLLSAGQRIVDGDLDRKEATV